MFQDKKGFTQPLREGRGLTLLELLVALTITVLLGASLAAIFRTSMDAWRRGEAATQRCQPARIALQRMSEEMRSAISLSEQQDGTVNTESFKGTANTVDFLTTSNPPDWNKDLVEDKIYYDVCEIGYYIHADGDRLMRHLQTANVPDGSIGSGGGYAELAPHVTGLNIEYYNGASWVNSWTASNTLPKIVKITLTVQADIAPAGTEKKEENISTRVYIPLGN